MTGLFVRVQNWLASPEGEKGQWNLGGPSGFLGLLIAVLLVVALCVFIWVNIDINEK